MNNLLRQIQARRIERLSNASQTRIRRPGSEDLDEYAFRARASGRLEITFTAGEAYMVNETPSAFSGSALVVSIPAAAGDYVVYLRHEYGVGAAAGTWGALTACLAADIPSELTDGRVVARNFKICSVTVTGSGADARIGTPVQRWRQGDVTGYAPYIAPEDGA